MRRTIGQSLRIGIAPHAVSLLRVSRWRGEAVTVLAEHAITPSAAHPFDAIASALRALLGEQQLAGWPAALVLADELVRLWRVTPPPGATRLDDLEAAAGLRFQALYGEAPTAWNISADWDAAQPFFAAAVPRALLASLQAVADDCKLSIVGIEPHCIAAWNRWRRDIKPGAWFALVHEQLLTLAPLDAGGLRAVRTLPLPPSADADPAWLTQTLRREALLLDMAAPTLLQACGALPPGWARTADAPGLIACEALDQAGRKGAALVTPLSGMARLALGGAA
ncbi:MAG: hypothetical protein ABW202_19460 [Duganella sp.]